jgi:DNA-binding PadR family transcriptional regulator
VLELAILGLLKEQELHGYELKKRLSEALGVGSRVSFGSLYPALARLEAADAVKAVEANDVGLPIPGTGSLGGELAAFRARKSGTRGSRGKKVYGITERGERLFDELLVADSNATDDERLFHLRLAFARYLPPDARLGLLERRRAYLLERLARTSGAIRSGWERLDAYTRSLIEHGNETTERDISWLDRLIARERETATDPAASSSEASSARAASSSGRTNRAASSAPTTRAAASSARTTRAAASSARTTRAASSAPTMPAPPAAIQEDTTS